mgnify:CR=1 FL=1
MSYLNKIILCFTKDKIVGYQYKDRIISQHGDEFETLQRFYDFYIMLEEYNEKRKKRYN